MSDDIRVVDPTGVARTEPVAGLGERTPFRVRDCRLVVLDVDDASAWHRREGAVYGWVRAGTGDVADGTGETTDLNAGDFLRVPGGSVHRYTAGDEPLEILAVVDGGGDVTEAEQPTADNGETGPSTTGRAGADPSTTGRADTGVEVVGPEGLVPTVESPDLRRETSFLDRDVLPMRVRAAGGAAAGWHHHGSNVYFGYAVDGPSETEYGPRGERVARIEAGECFHVPPGLVHRDTNPTDEPHTGIIWLRGGEPWVVNVDGPGGE